MPPSSEKKPQDDTKPNTSSPSGDLGAGEVQQAVDEAQEKGYFGSKVDPLPNSAHSLESGPDSPTVVEQRAALDEAAAKDGDAK